MTTTSSNDRGAASNDRDAPSHDHGSSAAPATRRIHGPAELAQAVPYLLGFHPHRSLVLVGLSSGVLVVTVRLDLADAAVPEVLGSAVDAMCDGGTTEIVAAVYDDPDPACAEPGEPLPRALLPAEIVCAAAERAARVIDVLHVFDDRWWSYTCEEPGCCPVTGNRLPAAPSAFTAAATYDGVVPLPDREALAQVLDPLPDTVRDALEPLLAEAENRAVAAVLGARADRHVRSVKRALFAAARESAQSRWVVPDDETVARFGAALLETALRDAVWLAVDDRRLDGRVLWRELARRLPTPYDATPLFLYGWAAWRAGNSALAGIAAERVLVSDPGYSAADLLLAALSQGVDPRRMPRLRRSA